jgi:hypothetical protein
MHEPQTVLVELTRRSMMDANAGDVAASPVAALSLAGAER